MASYCNLDLVTSAWLELSVGLAAARAVNDINQATSMDLLKKIEQAHGVIDRVTANVDSKLETVFALEKKVDDLSTRATAPKIRELDTISAHLTQVVQALEGNGGPLLGENQSTPSAGPSPENPTQAQS